VPFSIKNCGNADLHVKGITISGSYFSQTSTCAAAVAPGGSCVISIIFTPTSDLVFGADPIATLLIASDAAYSPQLIYLFGSNATEFDLGPVPPGSLTATVSPGQSATYSLQVTGGPGYSGTVAMNCYQSFPSGYDCIINNNFLQVESGTTQKFTVTIAPSHPAVASLWNGRRFGTITLPLLSALAVTLIAFSMRKRPTSPVGSLAGLLLCAGLIATLTCIAGCGGGSSGGSSGGTVASYSFQLVAADVNSSRTVNLMLNVRQ
jgi:hypothetical protein